jgi:hypothetical protein
MSGWELDAVAVTLVRGYANGSTVKLQDTPLKIWLLGGALTSSIRQE